MFNNSDTNNNNNIKNENNDKNEELNAVAPSEETFSKRANRIVSLVIDNKEHLEEEEDDSSFSETSSSGDDEEEDEERNDGFTETGFFKISTASIPTNTVTNTTTAIPLSEKTNNNINNNSNNININITTKPRSSSVEYSASPSKLNNPYNVTSAHTTSDDSNLGESDFKSRREVRSSSSVAAPPSGGWTRGKITPSNSSLQLSGGNDSEADGNKTSLNRGSSRLFTGTASRGGLASSKKFVNPSHYSSSVMVPVDKSSQFSLVISSTETVETSKKSYTVYVINVKSNDIVWTIVRRYKHVRAFSLKIQNEVPSLTAFDFPSKKIIGNMNPQFIKQRCNQLQLFFNAICESNLAKQSRNLKVFLDPNFSPSLKSITNPSKEGYLYLLIQRSSLSRKKRKWKKVYCVVVNANLFFWKTRNQYAEAKGVINLRHATAKITHTLDKLCVEVKIQEADSGAIRHKQFKSSVSSNSLALSCTGSREEDQDEEKYFLCSESEQKLVQWLETINKEINTAQNNLTASILFMQQQQQQQHQAITPIPNSTSTTTTTATTITTVNIPAPPPIPLSLSRSVLSKSMKLDSSLSNSQQRQLKTNPVPVKNNQQQDGDSNNNNIMTELQDESSYRVFIQNQEWSIDNHIVDSTTRFKFVFAELIISVDKGKGYKPTKDTINLLEATLSYKSVYNQESTIQQKNNNNNNNLDLNISNNNSNSNSNSNNSTSTFVMATPSTSSIHPSFSPIALGVSKIPNTPSSSNIPKHLIDKLKSKSNEIILLPSENIVFYSESIIHVHGNSGTIGRITLTNFRLYFAPYYGSKMSKKCETEGISVPLGMIEDIVKCTGFTPDKLKYYAFEIKCKDFHRIRFMHLPGSSQQKANSRLYEIFEPLIFSSEYSKLFCFASNNISNLDQSKGWNIYNPSEEYQRMGIPNESWRVTNFNNDYYYSPTYPSTMVVPKRITDLELINITSFRSKGRLPVLVWKHPKEYAVIVRSSQPVIGVTGKRCLEDEKLIENIRLANLDSERVYIMDARPQINAVANQVMGMGYEGTKSTYSNCVLKFLNIENIHKMREAQKKLFKTSMYEKEYDRYQLKLEKATNIWLEHIRSILCGVTEIVDVIRYLKSSVIIHCSDGWDRTSQLCALAELLLDPAYRTIVGFQKLIEKEWLSFGHKFESRIGQGSRVEKHTAIEHSPVFLQFIDCVYQILIQNPQRFEFNQQYLMEIIHHLYSCRFGTFLYDSEAERVTNELSKKTQSLWSYLNAHTSQWRNSSYQSNPEILSVDTMNLQLWNQYYLYWLLTKSEGLKVSFDEQRMNQKKEKNVIGLDS
ncbi:GRAM domain-containing protein [Heterostelium album PN500]|uniref:GRAM domain-containing protein n=1 Tax=Heterostelium pallidum (strain ATCC 26659 / Pp 5 / PN500) TaxID=670386 RepID=D3BT00_HETP5|nr:GRAM domain-containing protein [Heterostelium album PN500]EFA75615.1 GRAM domain-containing protein [Heterostelium album PN500]|eukprot:XP_020427749.1 GRAM domain-containing protein [Heterostelium album PN500]